MPKSINLLTNQEKQILQDYHNGKFVRIENMEQKRISYQKQAVSTLNKTERINLRISEKDLITLKKRAAKNGIPYQTLLTTLIRQYNQGQIEIKL